MANIQIAGRRGRVPLPVEPAPRDLINFAKAAPHRLLDAPASEQNDVRLFIAQSFKRWKTADAATWKLRREMRKDQEFASGGGNQWDSADRQAREDEGRPCLEINRIPQFIRQVSNQNRMNRSAIQVNARGKGSTTDLANALQGLIRGIEVESDADVAYDTATDHQLRSGLGFVRLRAQWSDDEDFTQVVKIARVRNPLAVFWDPSTQEADFADCRWMHVVGAIGKDAYQERWGKVSPFESATEFLMGYQQEMTDWMPEGKVIVVEYFTVDIEKRELLRLSTGDNIWAPELADYQEAYALSHPGEPAPQVVRSRMVDKKVVRWALHNAWDILEGNETRTAGRELPGTRIPIFPVMGDELDIDGVVDYRGMVRDARDPQRMYNFWSSSIAEAVALAPKAPWVAAKGQIEQYLEDWSSANRKAKAVLLYDPKAVGDHLVPPPQRNVVEPAVQAMVQGLAESNQDLMSVMGLFEPSLGQRGSHSESGKARELLQQQGVVANSNFLDNLQRTKRSIGRALLEWIPVIYDVPHVVHLLQPDGKKKMAVVYSGAENKPAEEEFPEIQDIYDVGVGHFDVTISTGPSYQTEKQATEAWLLELFKVLPGLAAVGADIVLENSDHEGAKQLAKRAKKMLPPQIQDESDPDAMLPMLQAKVGQLEQLLQLANEAISSMARTIETKEAENLTKKEVAMIQASTALQTAMLKAQTDMNLEAFGAELKRFQQMVDAISQETMGQMQQQGAERAQQQQQVGQLEQIDAQRNADMMKATQAAALAPEPAPPGGGA